MTDSIEPISGASTATGTSGGSDTQERAASRTAASGNKLPPVATNMRLVTQKQAETAASELNAYLGGINHELRFRADKVTGDIVVRVVDSRTHKVIRQMPAEALLKLSATLRRLGKLDTTGLRSHA